MRTESYNTFIIDMPDGSELRLNEPAWNYVQWLLREAKREAKREALLEAAVKVSDYHGKHFVDNALNCGDELRKMADDLKS